MHTLIKTYQFKLYQSRKLKHLEACINLAAEIWNWCIALHRRYYKQNLFSLVRMSSKKWTIWDSNPRPPACKAGALPSELIARIPAPLLSGRRYFVFSSLRSLGR